MTGGKSPNLNLRVTVKCESHPGERFLRDMSTTNDNDNQSKGFSFVRAGQYWRPPWMGVRRQEGVREKSPPKCFRVH